MPEEKEITIKKSTFNGLLVVVVAALVMSSFFGGYIFGGGGITGAFTQTESAPNTQTSTQQQTQPAQQQQPTQPQQPATQPSEPQRISVSLDNDPVVGSSNAPLTIVEFSDFQCPFCKRFFTQTLPQIEENYVQTGKVKFVYRDFPIDSIHEHATPAAEAAECANEQGKFWEFHDMVFENQQSLGVDSYKQWAKDLGLNTQQFDSCVDSRKYQSEVQKDFNDGRTYGVSGTPTFFVGNEKDGYVKLVGAQPYATFEQILNQ